MIASSTMKGTVSPSRGTKKVDLTIPTEEELKAILRETKAYYEDPKDNITYHCTSIPTCYCFWSAYR